MTAFVKLTTIPKCMKSYSFTHKNLYLAHLLICLPFGDDPRKTPSAGFAILLGHFQKKISPQEYQNMLTPTHLPTTLGSKMTKTDACE